MGRGNITEYTGHDGLAELYDTFGSKLFAYALSLVNDVADAEDVVQEVFVKIYAGRRLPDEPAAYLFRAARNAAYSRLRWRWIRKRLRPSVEQHMALFRNDEPSPEGMETATQEALQQLPIKQREVVMLKIWQGLTFQQIACVLGCSPNTVASRYRYAIDRLRVLLKEETP